VHGGVGDEPALALERVTVRYGRTVAVRGASLAVAQGELVALVGPNGAGKSTLFRAALGLVPYEGGIVVHQTRRRGVRSGPSRGARCSEP
jgi:ABC-type Mn2+/Zn2+ transport system ATPase subunit